MDIKKCIRATWKDLESKQTESSAADHGANYLTPGRNLAFLLRAVKEILDGSGKFIWIRRKVENNKSALMNADEGAYQFSHLYDRLIQRVAYDFTVSRPGSAASTV